jgi:pimeloyl-ACP methyl ester carboxylesterase
MTCGPSWTPPAQLEQHSGLVSEGGPMSIVFAATYPQRTSALILYGAMARFAWAPDNAWGRTDEQIAAGLKWIEEKWAGEFDRFVRSKRC